MHPTPAAPESSEDTEEDSDEEDGDSDSDSVWNSVDKDVVDDDDDEDDGKQNLYELYLKGEPMPKRYTNEHQKFVAARQHMHKLQEAKNTQVILSLTNISNSLFDCIEAFAWPCSGREEIN